MTTNHQKITKEYCIGRRLAFKPATIDEAKNIQEAFFRMGYAWITGQQKVDNVYSCVHNGMTLDNGALYAVLRDGNDLLMCHFDQIDAQYKGKYKKGETYPPPVRLPARLPVMPPVPLPPLAVMPPPKPEMTLEERYNILAAKVDGLDRKLDQIIDMLTPKDIRKDKPPFKP